MNNKTVLLGAAFAGSMLVAGAAQATTRIEISISGEGDPTTVFDIVLPTKHGESDYEDGFKTGSIIQITDGKKVADSYRFYSDDERGYFEDAKGLYKDSGAKIFGGGEEGRTFKLGKYEMRNEVTGHMDEVQITAVSGVPETSTWVMMLSGFAGLAFVAYRRSKLASVRA
jgi:hypothetical protein